MPILKRKKKTASFIIGTHPQSVRVKPGQRASFTAVAHQNGQLAAVQWQISRDNGQTWSDIINGQNSHYITEILVISDSNSQYRAKFSDLDGHEAFSKPAILLVDLLWDDERKGKKRKDSYLAGDTKGMARQRRLLEQEGHRRFARVNAREHPEELISHPDGELQNSIAQHPLLADQRYDGYDPNINPEPPLNTEARREFDNEQRKQEHEKQLRLGNMPQFSTAPRPGMN